MTAHARAAAVVDRITDGIVAREPETVIQWIEAEIIAQAEGMREEAAKRINIFQDIISWRPGESRNALIWEIEKSVNSIEVT